MSKKVSLMINRVRYDIDLDDAFADYLLEELKKDFKFDANNDLKVLLHAYVKKQSEVFEQEKKLEKLLAKIEESI
jgi:hypothetical protein